MNLKKWLHVFFLAGSLSILCGAVPASGANAEPDAVHAPAWAFGESLDRGAALWRDGQNADSILNKSKPAQKNKKSPKQDSSQAGKDSRSGKGKLGFSFANEGQTWKVTPDHKTLRPDEEMTRDRHHVFSAFADVEAAKDLSIKVGPELIVRDDEHTEMGAITDQPESELGVGMKFQYAF